MMSNCAWTAFLAVLPPRLRRPVDRQGSANLQELRLRLGKPPMLVTSLGHQALDGPVTAEEIQYVISLACRYSPWTTASAAQGYITIPGGHRIGMCGQALLRDGRMTGLGRVTSLNIRICRDFPGVSRNLGLRGGSVLLIGPPGSGKTTLLRDLIRQRSKAETVAVVDERGEIFPPAADFPTGDNTDVITGCGKAQGVETVLRVMGPQCIAVDEVTALADCQCLIQAGKCGVSLLATAHAADLQELRRRPIFARLLASGAFDEAVILRADKSWRTERIKLC